MAGITLSIASARLAEYLDAELAILGGQEYSIGSRRLKRADLAEVRAGILLWDQRVKELSSTAGGRSRSLTLRPKF